MGLFSTWSSVIGKVTNGAFSRKFANNLWSYNAIDYTRNDYDLYRTLYYGVSVNGKGKDMLIGAMFAKPIINSTAAFAIGEGFNISLDNKNSKKAQDEVNDWIDKYKAEILQAVIHDFRDGDAYLYVDEYGVLEEVDAKGVTTILDAKTGDVIGYDVEEDYTLRDANGQDTNYVVLKQYRTDSVRYMQYLANDTNKQNGTQIYYVVYTTEGPITPTENQKFYEGDIVHRPLPIVHLANDVEPRQVYGNSELLNCLVGIKNYHAIVANATKGVINNANPIPVMLGVKGAEQVAKQSNKGETDDTDKVNWEPDSILFIENPEADAKYIQANGFMDDTGKLLEYYFYLILEASETPEFVFGAAVQSSKASVQEQMPIVVAKANRKRSQLTAPIKQLVEAYIDRQIRLSNPAFFAFRTQSPVIGVSFPDIINEDKQMTLDIVKYLNEGGMLSDETALELLLNDKVDDIPKELDKARKDNEAQASANDVVPDQTGRLQNELNNIDQNQNDPNNTGATNNNNGVQ